MICSFAQRVTDMAFYADDVHLLATVSLEGLVYVWKIYEGPDNEDRPQITGNVVTAIQFLGGEAEGDYAHPRVCWHCNNRVIECPYLFCFFMGILIFIGFYYVP